MICITFSRYLLILLLLLLFLLLKLVYPLYGGLATKKYNTIHLRKFISVHLPCAVHVEVAYSLSTESCIMAIKRFVCHRGPPTEIYSHNGINFEGTSNELKTMQWKIGTLPSQPPLQTPTRSRSSSLLPRYTWMEFGNVWSAALK